VNRGKTLASNVQVGAFVTGGMIGIVGAAVVVLQGVLFDCEGTDGFGRGAMALIGLASLAAAVWAWRKVVATRSAA
jgi:hypothetical protein